MILREGARGALGQAKTNGRYVNESATVKKLKIKVYFLAFWVADKNKDQKNKKKSAAISWA